MRTTRIPRARLHRLVVAIVMWLSSSGCKDRYNGVNMSTGVYDLKFIEHYWLEDGRPAKFDINTVIRPGKNYSLFLYTNSVTVSGRVYHCHFGARRFDWPAGTLALTYEGQTLWIRDSDKKVTLSPEKHWIER